MPLYEVFSHSDRFHYRANLFSLATCFVILCTILTFLPPFLFAYFAEGFWIKEGSYSEQARVSYSGYIVTIDYTNSVGSQVKISSSYAPLNTAFRDAFISGINSLTSNDTNGNGIDNQFSIAFQFPFDDNTIVINNINVWLIFQYELRARQYINMKTMALINLYSNGMSLASNPTVTAEGNLIFQQRQPIQSSGNDITYNQSIIDTDSLLATSPIDFNPILNTYFKRKYYTSYQSESLKWASGTTSTDSSLNINITINVNSQSIRFIPGFWQEFKWGWIQYLSVLLPFIMIFNRIKEFVFQNQLVRTLVDMPRHRYKS
ncbi:unnamed protein product [Adineta steineri]|uniref:Transmembrane protein 231 n=1 Tax=Adineta steineri TaxID=433720 RepID=A0A814LGS1_9BILA|nr:unnamed protein product [Adineta steineri]CAF1169667.1 unnamed protein product [Adineta steineri]